ncbi:MAG: glycosyltransferase family 2 protein [Brevundimonas sp.]|nr:glycosyltransferase family 2 protein [Brevundimonas sp.]
MFQSRPEQFNDAKAIDVSIIMPCLNETQSLSHCIANARLALDLIEQQYGLGGEIVIADNGSTDGSQALAESLGARVVDVPSRGYGAALIGGCTGAYGRYLLMGDCDGSYNFTEGVAMIGKLEDGWSVCMGSRFKGGIAPGAMPWKNRWIGNPALTGILNLFFRTGISDAHCGLRAIRKEAFHALRLSGSGMEFASEMVIKAALLKLPMTEVPATLSPDLREREPHLRPWRDGWRHLRYLFMLSPTWVFGVPALAALGSGLAIMALALLHLAGIGPDLVGASWILVGAMLACLGHMGGLMAVAAHLFGVREGYRRPRNWLLRLRGLINLETLLISGGLMITGAIAGLVATGFYWSASSFAALPSTLPVALAGTLGVIGMQNAFGAFLLAIIGGNEADFLKNADAVHAERATPPIPTLSVPALQGHTA